MFAPGWQLNNKIFSDRKVLLLLNISLIKLVIFILKIENTSF